MMRTSTKTLNILLLWGAFSIALKLASASIQGTPPRDDEDTFDFIIVGGGTAGCVLASRLSASGKHSVLVLEEGGIPSPNLEVPGLAGFFDIINYTNDTKIYPSVPQRNAALVTNGTIPYIIGKVIGGGSSVNSMFWNRGSPHGYDNWANLTKDESWSYANLLKYFRRSEDYLGVFPTLQRGYGGPITVTSPNYAPGMRLYLQAGQEIGYPIGDPNGPQTPSISVTDWSINGRGRRVSAYKGYIQPLLQLQEYEAHGGKRNWSNLKILLNTEAKRLIFEGNKAVGVTFVSNSSTMVQARAKKEVIISAGALDTPAFLMRNGIGPAEELRKLNIPVRKALPVGRNLQDHILFVNPIIYGNRSPSIVLIPSRDYSPETWRLYEETGTGPYSSMLGVNTQGFFLSSLQKSSTVPNWPDIHVAINPSEFNTTEELGPEEIGVTWGTIVSRPKSRGTVTLNPENVEGQPIVDFQHLTHPDDMRVMLDAVNITVRMCESTKAMQSIGCRLPNTPFPACSRLPYRSEAYWTCFIRILTFTTYHASGTCSMGSGAEDPEAVVNSELKVIGIDGLRVVDASVAPTVSNANTQAMVYVIAEKAADMILKQWGGKTGSSPRHYFHF